MDVIKKGSASLKLGFVDFSMDGSNFCLQRTFPTFGRRFQACCPGCDLSLLKQDSGLL